jgi:hypothetical protein
MRRPLPLLVALATVALVAPAHTAEETPPAGDIVFARDGALWRIAADGTSEPSKLAALPAGDLEVRALASSADGRLLVVDLDGVAGWVQPGANKDDVRQVAIAPCAGPGRPAADGTKLVCPGGPSTTVIQPNTWKAHELDVAPEEVDFLGPTGDELIVAGSGEIRAVKVDAPDQTRALAPHRPDSHLLASPDGKRAAGRYERSDAAIYSFRLDGKAAKRKIGAGVVPITWSPDSQWLLMGNEKRACIARAIGGEYKCWGRYTAAAFSPDSRHVLLSRKGALYTAAISGTEPARPKRVVEKAGPATWIP